MSLAGGSEEAGVQTQNLIGGVWVRAENGAEIDVRDPATDEVIARVPSVGTEETGRGVGAAHDAFMEWRARTGAERGEVLRRWHGLILRDIERLAALMTSEQGKPLAEARGEIRYAASFVEWASEEAKRVYGEIVPSNARSKRILVLRQPVGVCAVITPWNFPAAMITRKVGPALAAGCTVVVKPAEATPLSAIALGELALEAGVPGGVINIVTGDAKEIGGALLSDARVRKVSFTGSTEVGRVLMRGSADRLHRLSMELGGHAPFIVFDDADMDAAIETAVACKLRNAGQTCICANRFYVHEHVHDRFVGGLVEAMRGVRVGRGTEEGVGVGPLINDEAVEKVERHVRDAVERGGKVLCGGERVRIDGLADRFYAPTVVDGCPEGALMLREETFGPVAPVRSFREEAEAVRWANESEYGLAAYFFTRDASRVVRVAEALEYGIVGANDAAPSTAQAPFGGVKQSGFGREGGKWVMDEYTQVKYVSWGV